MTNRRQQNALSSGSRQQAFCDARGIGFELVALIVVAVYPACFTWLYFVALSPTGPAWQRIAYLVGKAAQFILPVVWLLLGLPPPARIGGRSWRWLAAGLVFGSAVLGVMSLAYNAWLHQADLLQAAADNVRHKLGEFGIDSLAEYALLAVGYCVVHSLLEEYYWRWFVFGSLLRRTSIWAAVAVSSLAFAGHHVIVLASYFHLLAALLGSLAVACGGAVWAWLYARSGSLVAVWASHSLVDAAIFLIGGQMAFGT